MTIFKHLPDTILASTSPRREMLLKQIGLEFEICPSNVHEDFSVKLSPPEFVRHYARLKARDIARSNPSALVVGADTIVVLDKTILGKPNGAAESKAMLESLSGRTHTVMTGVSLQFGASGLDQTFVEKTRVTFKVLTDIEINHYIENFTPFDKAGSYGIQDWFSVCVERIEGCFYNVMGFPLSAFYRRLMAAFPPPDDLG